MNDLDEKSYLWQISDSSLKVMEVGWAKLMSLGRLERVASLSQGFSKGDVLVVSLESGDVLARSISDSVKVLGNPKSYVNIVRCLSPSEAVDILTWVKAKEQEARRIFKREVAKHNLEEMHLSGIDIVLNDTKIIFYFTAPGRVDFRSLVRDLASALRSRIELRQFGVRDEARCCGGLGPCGLPVCCSTFLTKFTGVTIRMAKSQGLVLNPQKVSGICGRLMCCLAYEYETYCQMLKDFPKIGSLVKTPKGEGKVVEIQLLKGIVRVQNGNDEVEGFAVKDVVVLEETQELVVQEEIEESQLKSLED